jgi:hypothetical protein
MKTLGPHHDLLLAFAAVAIERIPRRERRRTLGIMPIVQQQP